MNEAETVINQAEYHLQMWDVWFGAAGAIVALMAMIVAGIAVDYWLIRRRLRKAMVSLEKTTESLQSLAISTGRSVRQFPPLVQTLVSRIESLNERCGEDGNTRGRWSDEMCKLHGELERSIWELTAQMDGDRETVESAFRNLANRGNLQSLEILKGVASREARTQRNMCRREVVQERPDLRSLYSCVRSLQERLNANELG